MLSEDPDICTKSTAASASLRRSPGGVVLSGPPFPTLINDRTYVLCLPSSNERISVVGLTLALLIFDLQLQRVVQIVTRAGGNAGDLQDMHPYLEIQAGNGAKPNVIDRLVCIKEISAVLTTLMDTVEHQ